MWHYTGQQRPDFAIAPGPGQESVWDYPRPPRLVADQRTVEVRLGDQLLAQSSRCMRVLETASPPTFYLPSEEVNWELLSRVQGQSFCEWKGPASYLGQPDKPQAAPVGWCYPSPSASFAAIAGWPSFYPGRIECRVDGERVKPQPGGFYGGWITGEICGPVKGEPGTGHW